MAKPLLRIKARNMRSKGESVRQISKKLNVSKGTASLWVRDIVMSVEQLEKLTKRKIKGGELGRLRGALIQKKRRLDLIEKCKKDGEKEFDILSERELFIAGLALYWAEGSKKTREARVCNSDPRLMNFMIAWFRRCFGVEIEELVASVGINEIHKDRELKVKKYWVKNTGIPLCQFRKTSFKKVKNKKVYRNFNNHYGTLNVNVLRPARIYYRIMGLIHGLAEAEMRPVSRGVS